MEKHKLAPFSRVLILHDYELPMPHTPILLLNLTVMMEHHCSVVCFGEKTQFRNACRNSQLYFLNGGDLLVLSRNAGKLLGSMACDEGSISAMASGMLAG